MRARTLLIVIGIITLIAITGLLALMTAGGLDPAFAAAVDFANAAGSGDDAKATALLDTDLQMHVAQNCADGSVSACVMAYTPPEWGKMLKTVFRRAQPDGQNAWDVLLIATYEKDKGFSGVCIYTRMEQTAAPAGDNYAGWRVVRWSGFVSCNDSDAELSGLTVESAPNRAP